MSTPLTEVDIAKPEVTVPVRVLLVGDRQIAAEGLRSMLAPYDRDVRMVAAAPPTEEIGALACQLGADIVLLDIATEPRERLELAERLLTGKPAFHVVIFSVERSQRYVLEALRRGASGYLLESCAAAELANQLLRVRKGEVVIDTSLAAEWAVRASMTDAVCSWPGAELGLTKRQGEVMSLLTEGLSNRLIAERLVIGEETVKTHLRASYRTLGVSDRTAAVAKVLRNGALS